MVYPIVLIRGCEKFNYTDIILFIRPVHTKHRNMEILEDTVFFIVLSLYLYYVILLICTRYFVRISWKEIDAQINKINISVETEITETKKVIENKTINMEYEYQIKNNKYFGSSVGIFDNLLIFTNYDDKLFNKINNKEYSKVFYNPNNYSQSCYVKSFYSRKILILLSVALFLTVLSIYSYIETKSLEFTFLSILACFTAVILIAVEQFRIYKNIYRTS